jgi:hypothetical protein
MTRPIQEPKPATRMDDSPPPERSAAAEGGDDHKKTPYAPGRYASLEHIYKKLFGEAQSDVWAAMLKEAVRVYSPSIPGSETRVLEVLRELNDGADPQINVSQIQALKKLFLPPRPISPAQKDLAAALEARRFWHALVFGGVEQVRELWKRLHDYDVNGGDENRARVVEQLERMVPGSAWSDGQLDSLVSLAVHEVEFRNLAWWDTFQDAW